jgi:hypothetical protein
MRESTERWMQLCAQAATEEDPMKVIALVNEINDLLEQKERRLGMLRAGKGDSETSMAWIVTARSLASGGPPILAASLPTRMGSFFGGSAFGWHSDA